jgi:hypothetical protein
MKQYHIVIRGPREKVKLIKMLRTFDCFGLKQAKDLIEARVEFDSWMDEQVKLELIVTAEQLGHRLASDLTDGDSFYISDCELIKPQCCDFDLATQSAPR